jgi:hypothetical protein
MIERFDGDMEAFSREVLRDARSGFGGWMYPTFRDMGFVSSSEWEPKDHEHASIYLLIDPGLSDATAMHWVLADPVCRHDVVIKSYESTNREDAEYIASIIAGANPDDYPKFFYSPRIRELLEWVRSIPEPKMAFGDPYGYRTHAGNDDSWYQRIIRWLAENNPRLNPITGKPNVYPFVVKTKSVAGDARSYQTRRQALMKWGRERLLFTDDPEVRATLHAIQNSRWDDDDRPRATEQKDAKHDKYSHRRSAMEYGAVNMQIIEHMESPAGKNRKYQKGTRTSLGPGTRRKGDDHVLPQWNQP